MNLRFFSCLKTVLLVSGLTLVVSACATTKQFIIGEQPVSPYSDYLLARYANSEADMQKAAKYYARALKTDPSNMELRQRVMLSSALSSDIKQAAIHARVILATDANDRMAVMIAATDDIKSKKYGAAVTRFDQVVLGPLNQVAGGFLHSWALQGLGETDQALKGIAKVANTPLLGGLAGLQKALILHQAGRQELAEQAFEQAINSRVMTARIAYVWSSLKINEGDKIGAKKLLDQRVDLNANEIEAKYLLARLNSKSRIGSKFTTPQQGAAEALLGPAQAMAERGIHLLSILYLEMAIYLDPNHDAGRNLLARLYELQDRPEDALDMYATIKPSQPWYLQTKMDTANTLFRTQKTQQGLEILNQLVEENPSKDSMQALAMALRSDKQYEKALVIYNQLISTAPDEADWRLYFARGITLERTNRWREAVPDFRKSLQLRPDQADVLNYLGYTFVDSGENLEEGFELIKKAILLRPEAGHIVDSLGWGYYRLGNFEDAVTELERAVELSPGDPTINDHLGDAYWQVGRKLEAKFQWQKVLSFEPDDEVDIGLVKDKIANGLRAQDKTHLASE